MNKIKLFCFPYAGGSASFYERWKTFLHPTIELIPVELAGRSYRIREAHYETLDDAIDDIYKIIKKDVSQYKYALLGHSMGGLICYRLAKKILEYSLPPPLHLFISGRRAPHVERADKKQYHLLSNDLLTRELIHLGGTPPEIFQHPELLELFLPIIKNDFKIVEQHEINIDKVRPFNIDMTVFYGRQDESTLSDCNGWRDYTTASCNIQFFDGGHFFLHQKERSIVAIINDTIGKRGDVF